MRNAKNAADLLRGYTMPGTDTKTFTGPRTRDYYQQSDLGKISGVLSMIGGAAQGKEGEGLNRLLNILKGTGEKGSSIINSLLNPANLSSASVGQGEIDAMKAAGVYDDYEALVNSITNPTGNEDFQSYYSNIFDALEGEDAVQFFGN
jgi:hypothetical protein